MPDEQEHLRKAADIISELLVSVLLPQPGEKMADCLRPWERDALLFLSEQRRRDPSTGINDWTARRVDEFESGRFRNDALTS